VVALVIRSRTDVDLDALLAVLRESHRTDGYPLMAKHVTTGWLTEKGDPAWVAQLDGAVVGHAALSGVPGAELELARLFVSGTSRGNGVAAALVETAERFAASTGSTLALEVLDHNTAAIRLYERRGWVRTGSEPADWFGPEGPAPLVHFYKKS
jgi:ribosomal-protein-alanine N-acetyltransferase